MDGNQEQLPFLFATEKFISTIFSYFSGMAGGIFSPTLSIDAGIGYATASLLQFVNIKICALIGMVAFMIAAVVAQLVGRIFMPTPLYHYLAFGEKHAT